MALWWVRRAALGRAVYSAPRPWLPAPRAAAALRRPLCSGTSAATEPGPHRLEAPDRLNDADVAEQLRWLGLRSDGSADERRRRLAKFHRGLQQQAVEDQKRRDASQAATAAATVAAAVPSSAGDDRPAGPGGAPGVVFADGDAVLPAKAPPLTRAELGGRRGPKRAAGSQAGTGLTRAPVYAPLGWPRAGIGRWKTLWTRFRDSEATQTWADEHHISGAVYQSAQKSFRDEVARSGPLGRAVMALVEEGQGAAEAARRMRDGPAAR